MVDQRDAERARFVLSLITEALAPSNWVFNPVALKRLLETGGASAVRGIRHLLSDIRHNGFMPSMTDKNAFTVGKDLANTPGAVVFRHEMFELIQYAPRAEKVFRRPFLFVPPQINKFYLYDLAPKKSLIRYALDNGLQVFVISWRNPILNTGTGALIIMCRPSTRPSTSSVTLLPAKIVISWEAAQEESLPLRCLPTCQNKACTRSTPRP